MHDDAPPAARPVPLPSGPPALRIALCGRLRRLREAAGRTPAILAAIRAEL